MVQIELSADELTIGSLIYHLLLGIDENSHQIMEYDKQTPLPNGKPAFHTECILNIWTFGKRLIFEQHQICM